MPGQQFRVTASIINGGPLTYSGASVNFDLPQGWEASLQPPQAEGQGGGRGGRGAEALDRAVAPGRRPAWRCSSGSHPSQPGVVSPGQKYDQVYLVKVPATASFTQPYWLRETAQRRSIRVARGRCR